MDEESQLSLTNAGIERSNDLFGLGPDLGKEGEMKFASKGSEGEDRRVVGDDGEVEGREGGLVPSE